MVNGATISIVASWQRSSLQLREQATFRFLLKKVSVLTEEWYNLST